MLGEVGCSTLLYWLLSLVIIFPPEEAISAGLTIEHFLKFWLGSESLSFVHYHIKRSSASIIAHSLLLPGYITTLHYCHPWLRETLAKLYHPWLFEILFGLSLIPVVVTLIVVKIWSLNGWRNHPFAKSISLYTSNELSLATLTSQINNEFIGIDKVTSNLNSVSRVIATSNWLIKVTSYRIHLVSLRDAILVLEACQDATFVTSSNSPAQYLTLRVASLKEGIPPFGLRVNSTVWVELEHKLSNPVVNTRHIVVHQTLSDRFFGVFELAVKKNPRVNVESDQRDLCIGCMGVRSNVKLERRCLLAPRDGGASTPASDCTPCSCRPIWCLGCLCKWFAGRQDQSATGSWLSSKAPCPTCRSKFCLLDVCLIE